MLELLHCVFDSRFWNLLLLRLLPLLLQLHFVALKVAHALRHLRDMLLVVHGGSSSNYRLVHCVDHSLSHLDHRLNFVQVLCGGSLLLVLLDPTIGGRKH